MSLADSGRPVSTDPFAFNGQVLEEDEHMNDPRFHHSLDSSPANGSRPTTTISQPNDQPITPAAWPQSFAQYTQPYAHATSAPPMQNIPSHTQFVPGVHQEYHNFVQTNSPHPSFVQQDFNTPGYSETVTSAPSTIASPGYGDLYWSQGYGELADQEALTAQTSYSTQPEAESSSYAPKPELYPEYVNPQVLTPQSSSTSSPATSYHTQSQRMVTGPNYCVPMYSSEVPVNMQARPQPQLAVQSHLTPAQSGPSSNASPADPVARMPSPIVRVSMHNRGDSPARNGTESGRATGKRERPDRSSMLLPEQEVDSSEDEAADEVVPPARDYENTTSLMENERAKYSGLDPASRNDEEVPSLQDIEEEKHIAEKNADVEDWLAKSETGSNGPQDSLRVQKVKRPRAISAGGRALGLGIVDDRMIPGPGALVHEDSDEEEEPGSETLESSDPESPVPLPDSEAHRMTSGYFPPIAPPTLNLPEQNMAQEDDPLPRDYHQVRLWQDPFRGGPIQPAPGEYSQPASANAAMYLFDLQSKRFDAASRAATWGTRRRTSETDIQSLLSDESALKRLSIAPLSPSGWSRKGSLLDQAMDKGRTIIRKTSINRPKSQNAAREASRASPPVENKRGDSSSSIKTIQRRGTFNRPGKSPPLNTGSAFMAMTGQMAAIGGSGSVKAQVPTPESRSATRKRSRSELPPGSKLDGTLSLTQLMTKIGGPPMPYHASPRQEKGKPFPTVPQTHLGDDDVEGEDDDDEDDVIISRPVKMNLDVKAANIVPNHDGFKTHARELNPRSSEFLLDRIATEQLRRFKKLMENKVKHTQAVQTKRHCPSGDRCNTLGDGPIDLEPRRNPRDATSTTVFAVAGTEDDELHDSADGAVNAASFPEGIPMPPVKRLPAEFECTLCFKVKKFQKPSDWTKHVHEDVQPFTCTFPKCADPKSFKRKADWVRHENEKHRQLEWWTCNVPECSHVCYRKDNFVQHLVREHKKPEPKVKPRGQIGKAALAGAAVVDEVWRLVEKCHSETDKKPRDEACKFCGNVCGSWKRLTVHLARHMEQISLPMLKLVEQKNVSPDTVISPPPVQPQPPFVKTVSPAVYLKEDATASPFPMHLPLHPHQSSASPMVGQMPYSQPHHPSQQGFMNMQDYGEHMPMAHPTEMNPFPDQTGYVPYVMDSSGYRAPTTNGAINNPTAATYPPPYNVVPRHMQQRASPHPSHASHPDFGVNMNGMGGMSAEEQTVYSSPIEGQFGFQAGSNMSGVGMDGGMTMYGDNGGSYQLATGEEEEEEEGRRGLGDPMMGQGRGPSYMQGQQGNGHGNHGYEY